MFDKLKTSFENNILPGWEAQKIMSPSGTTDYLKEPINPKIAAVMAILFRRNGELRLCYIKRSSRIKEDKHAGQISFPGGKMELEDEDELGCAIRETHEEVGINIKPEQIIGELSPIYVFVSDFLVYPYVAYLAAPPEYLLQEDEVDSIIEVPLSTLRDINTIKLTDLAIRQVILKNVPYYDLNGEILWGATAMMTAELLAILP